MRVTNPGSLPFEKFSCESWAGAAAATEGDNCVGVRLDWGDDVRWWEGGGEDFFAG